MIHIPAKLDSTVVSDLRGALNGTWYSEVRMYSTTRLAPETVGNYFREVVCLSMHIFVYTARHRYC